jgi:hypothetical protein
MKRVLQIDEKDKVKNRLRIGRGWKERGQRSLGRMEVIPLIGHIDVFILNGHSINGIFEWFEYWNTIKGVELRLHLPKD